MTYFVLTALDHLAVAKTQLQKAVQSLPTRLDQSQRLGLISACRAVEIMLAIVPKATTDPRQALLPNRLAPMWNKGFGPLEIPLAHMVTARVQIRDAVRMLLCRPPSRPVSPQHANLLNHDHNVLASVLSLISKQ